jgi:hypothetical protein
VTDAPPPESPPTPSTEPQPADAPSPAAANAQRWRFRLIVGLLIAAVVAIGGINVSRREPGEQTAAPVAPGTVLDGDITLITSDRNDIACASDQAVQSYRCGFKDNGTAASVAEKDKLQTFMTVDRHMYVIPGLFLEPAIARRYDSEPPKGPRDQLKRFTARCKLTVIGNLTDFKLRFLAADAWSQPQKAEVATVKDCKIL